MSISLDDVARFGRDSVITTVGLGALLLNEAQARRRELGRAWENLLRSVGDGTTPPTKTEDDRSLGDWASTPRPSR